MLRLSWCMVLLAACASDDSTSGPIDDCAVQPDGTMICARSFPGCTFAPDRAVQFVHCGHRYEYTVYDRAAGCPELFYFPEGTFLDVAAWEDHVGACMRHDRR